MTPLAKSTKEVAVAAFRQQNLPAVLTFSVPPHYFTEWTPLMRREKNENYTHLFYAVHSS